MTYEQYWYGKPSLVVDYRKAYEIKKEMKSHEQWLNGVYVYTAVSTALGNAFREKGQKPIQFPSEPLDKPKKPKTDEELRLEMYEQLTRFKENWDAGHQNESSN